MEKYLQLKNNSKMPRLGMGTWYLGEDNRTREAEIKALQAGVEAGAELIDTAEMYGGGRAERLVGEALPKYNRKKLFLVSKVYPHNAGRNQIFDSIKNSLDNLRTDYLDLYLLHWRGSIPLAETVECMEELVREGRIKNWGVSNFDTDDMKELFTVPGGENCAVNQVLYHLGSRGIEYDLMPWLEEHEIPVMAYCPLAQAGALQQGLLKSRILLEIAAKYQITVMQLLLAFVLNHDNVTAIPRSKSADHVLENMAVRDLKLEADDYEAMNRTFPAPASKTYLDIV